MPPKGFTLIELVVLALLLGIIALIALPHFSDSVRINTLPTFAASKEKAFIQSMKADLLKLAVAEEAYYRDSLKYTVTVACVPTPLPGAATLCPSRGNLLGGPVVAGPGWGATMTNDHLPGVVCAIYVNYPSPPPGARDGTPACK
jgi:prepilin-type N-terminal cleavage/methylation domain-containing protein